MTMVVATRDRLPHKIEVPGVVAKWQGKGLQNPWTLRILLAISAKNSEL